MQPDGQEEQEFITILAAAFAIYGRDVSPGIAELYWNALQRFDLEDIRKAISMHVQNPDNGQFVPKPADLIRCLEGTSGSAAMIAWSRVEKAIRHIGPYRTVVFDDPGIHAAISDMGGWISLNNVSLDELPFIAKEFEKRYQGYKMQGGPREYPRELIGIAQAENEQAGRNVESPVLIGERGKAEKLYLGCLGGS